MDHPPTPGNPKKRVLILSASAGAGHMRAADALLQDFQKHPDTAEVQHWDILKYTTKLFRYLYSQVYLDLVNKAPSVFGFMYDKSDTPWKNEKVRLAFEKFNSRPFIDALQTYKPDLTVCTHFTPPFIISNLVEEKKTTIKPAIVVTDMDCHATWLVRHYQHYFLAMDETRVYMERMGIAGDRISVTGIPVDPVFRQPKSKSDMRQKHSLDPDRFTIMVSAGGFGVGPVEEMIRELLRLQCPAQVIAIAGKSEELKAKLDKLAASSVTGVKLVPVGFTKQMDEFMAASDILISKPGGLTTAEAMARGLPMCIANPIPGQEERNSDHLLEAGVAIKSNSLPTLAWKLERLLRTPGKLETLRENAVKFGKPDAGPRIVETLMNAAPQNP